MGSLQLMSCCLAGIYQSPSLHFAFGKQASDLNKSNNTSRAEATIPNASAHIFCWANIPQNLSDAGKLDAEKAVQHARVQLCRACSFPSALEVWAPFLLTSPVLCFRSILI